MDQGGTKAVFQSDGSENANAFFFISGRVGYFVLYVRLIRPRSAFSSVWMTRSVVNSWYPMRGGDN